MVVLVVAVLVSVFRFVLPVVLLKTAVVPGGCCSSVKRVIDLLRKSCACAGLVKLRLIKGVAKGNTLNYKHFCH